MKKYKIAFVFISFTFVLIHSCKKDEGSDADKTLYAEITASGYLFYQNGSILSAAGNSPHGQFKLRFNSSAQSVLDSVGELPSGASFPSGSIVVKEVYSGSSISLFAVMKKEPGNANAGSGWLWAEFETDGKVKVSTGDKGSSCTSCHSQSPHRDFIRTFDLH